MTWTSPNAPTMTFAGFKSRWITRRRWAYAIAWQTWAKTPTSSACRAGGGVGAAGQQRGQRVALDQLHRVVGPAVRELPPGMHRHDGRVRQLAGDAGLGEEPADCVGVVAHRRLDHLDGQRPLEVQVL